MFKITKKEVDVAGKKITLFEMPKLLPASIIPLKHEKLQDKQTEQ